MILMEGISVVIPAYNAEKHLRECIASVLSERELVREVIVINDGSTDGTKDLLQELTHLDRRIKAINGPNLGVSAARNRGLSMVSSEYFAFVDSDDMVPENAFRLLYSCARRYNSDLTYGGYAIFGEAETKRVVDDSEWALPGTIPARSLLVSLLSPARGTLSGACWRVLFKTAFIRDANAFFPEGVAMAEDTCFVFQCLASNPIVAYSKCLAYYLRRGEPSVSQDYLPSIEHDLDTVNSILYSRCKIDEELSSLIDESASKSAWAICANAFKVDSPIHGYSRYKLVKRVLSQYRGSIRRMSFRGGMGPIHIMLMKIGTNCPSVFCLAFLLIRLLSSRTAYRELSRTAPLVMRSKHNG